MKHPIQFNEIKPGFMLFLNGTSWLVGPDNNPITCLLAAQKKPGWALYLGSHILTKEWCPYGLYKISRNDSQNPETITINERKYFLRSSYPLKKFYFLINGKRVANTEDELRRSMTDIRYPDGARYKFSFQK